MLEHETFEQTYEELYEDYYEFKRQFDYTPNQAADRLIYEAQIIRSEYKDVNVNYYIILAYLQLKDNALKNSVILKEIHQILSNNLMDKYWSQENIDEKSLQKRTEIINELRAFLY